MHYEYRLKRSKDYYRNKVVKKIEEKLKASGEVLDYSSIENDYTGQCRKYEIICPKHGSFMEYPYRLMVGPRMSLIVCPMCRREQFEEKKKEVLKERIQRRNEQIHLNMKLAIKAGLYSFINVKGDIHEAFRKALYKRHPKGYDFSNAFYKGCNAKFDFVCEVHGPGETTVKNVRSCSSPCLKCGVENKWNVVRMDLKYIEDYIAKKYNGMYTVVKETFETGTKNFDVMCKEHGRWSTTWRTLKVSGCKKCYIERNKVTFDKFVELANKIHNGKYTYPVPSDEFSASGKVTVVCREHGAFETSAGDHTRMTRKPTGCPFCAESEGESIIRHVLNNLGINYIRQYRVPNTLMRFDFFLPNPGIVIEYNGYQHYHIVKHFGGCEGLTKRMKNDKYKANWCKRNEHHLEIFKYDIPYSKLGSAVVTFLKKMKLPKRAFISEEHYNKYVTLRQTPRYFR